ncbi:IS1096 element passenger TnpR family protein [Peptococcus simiae]|uniref:IS1096 element passenger TnpR family protein n=1 Tax=Peptococcus simiae TaxID=1643805 RepID=UPI00397FC9D5
MQAARKIMMTFTEGDSPVWRELLVPYQATAADLGRWLSLAGGYSGRESWELLCHEFKMRITEDRQLLDEAKALKAQRQAEAEAKGEEAAEVAGETIIVRASDLPLAPFLTDHPKLTFIYDMTDEWRWQVTAEDMNEPVAGQLPRLVQGMGTAPFVGVGGLQGYYDLVSELTENGPEARAIRDWLDREGLFFYDADRVQAALGQERENDH